MLSPVLVSQECLKSETCFFLIFTNLCLTCEQPEIVSLVWNDYILLFGLFYGFIGLDVRFTKEEPFKLNKEQNTDLKKGTHINKGE